jgi:hypothetical protein
VASLGAAAGLSRSATPLSLHSAAGTPRSALAGGALTSGAAAADFVQLHALAGAAAGDSPGAHHHALHVQACGSPSTAVGGAAAAAPGGSSSSSMHRDQLYASMGVGPQPWGAQASPGSCVQLSSRTHQPAPAPCSPPVHGGSGCASPALGSPAPCAVPWQRSSGSSSGGGAAHHHHPLHRCQSVGGGLCSSGSFGGGSNLAAAAMMAAAAGASAGGAAAAWVAAGQRGSASGTISSGCYRSSWQGAAAAPPGQGFMARSGSGVFSLQGACFGGAPGGAGLGGVVQQQQLLLEGRHHPPQLVWRQLRGQRPRRFSDPGVQGLNAWPRSAAVGGGDGPAAAAGMAPRAAASSSGSAYLGAPAVFAVTPVGGIVGAAAAGGAADGSIDRLHAKTFKCAICGVSCDV